MTTPTYEGTGQPAADNGSGFAGRFGSFLGSTTPAYAGTGQPSSSGSMFGGATPSYASAPNAFQTNAKAPAQLAPQVAVTCADGSAPQVVLTWPIDLDDLAATLAAGKVAVIVPRQLIDSQQ